jgi:hypothetical protein
MDSIDKHPRLGALLSISNMDLTVTKYISLQEIIGPDHQSSHAEYWDILDRASFDAFKQNAEVRSLLVDPTTNMLGCWHSMSRRWVPIEDACSFCAFIKRQVVDRQSQVYFAVSPRSSKSAARIYRFRHRLTIDRASFCPRPSSRRPFHPSKQLRPQPGCFPARPLTRPILIPRERHGIPDWR